MHKGQRLGVAFQETDLQPILSRSRASLLDQIGGDINSAHRTPMPGRDDCQIPRAARDVQHPRARAQRLSRHETLRKVFNAVGDLPEVARLPSRLLPGLDRREIGNRRRVEKIRFVLFRCQCVHSG